MDDSISRRAAINVLCELMSHWFGSNCMDERREIKMELDKLPSVQPERKKGKWIKLYTGNYKCSECGDWWGSDDNDMVENFHYCPNCGAWMGGQDENNRR